MLLSRFIVLISFESLLLDIYYIPETRRQFEERRTNERKEVSHCIFVRKYFFVITESIV